MALTEDQMSKAIAALREKAPNGIVCTVCGTKVWTAEKTGLASIALQGSSEAFALGGPSLPNLALVCRNCGHTLLFNVISLGLADLFGVSPTPSDPGQKK